MRSKFTKGDILVMDRPNQTPLTLLVKDVFREGKWKQDSQGNLSFTTTISDYVVVLQDELDPESFQATGFPTNRTRVIPTSEIEKCSTKSNTITPPTYKGITYYQAAEE